MSERKYRQRGYQDEPRAPRDRKPEQPKKEYAPRGQPPIAPKTFSMPGFREVVKCARCGGEFASLMMVRDLAVVEQQLGFSYELSHPKAEHYQQVCPKCRRALFGLAQGAMWRR